MLFLPWNKCRELWHVAQCPVLLISSREFPGEQCVYYMRLQMILRWFPKLFFMLTEQSFFFYINISMVSPSPFPIFHFKSKTGMSFLSIRWIASQYPIKELSFLFNIFTPCFLEVLSHLAISGKVKRNLELLNIFLL